jgi:hypothetical protein
MSPRFYVALLHYPVYDRRGRVVTTAVTNLDIHDISRSSRTYGAERFYIVTPIERQQDLVRKILRHWQEGPGALSNPSRREAFGLAEVRGSLEEVLHDISGRTGQRATVIVTGAGFSSGLTGFQELRKRMAAEGGPCLLVFGTGSGLAAEVLEQADFVLEPLGGAEDYNHLSVRSAVAVVLDRLCRQRP